MLKRIKNLLGRNSLVLAIGSSVLVLILSLIKMDNVPNFNFTYADKLEHIIAYSAISFFWLLSNHLGKIQSKQIYVIIVVLLFGVAIEVMQNSLTVYRTGDLIDMLANSIGCFLGYVFLRLLKPIYLQV